MLMNPWNVSDLSDFLRYCCPECDYRCEQVHSFCNHAIEEHENAKVLIRKEQFEESQIEANQEFEFEDSEHALQNHSLSTTFFHGVENAEENHEQGNLLRGIL